MYKKKTVQDKKKIFVKTRLGRPNRSHTPKSPFINEYTELMLHVEEGNLPEIYSLLRRENNASLNAMNQTGQTALAIATRNGNFKIVEFLIGKGADLNTQNQSGQTPLFIACWFGFDNIAELLINHNADVNLADYRGWTPLMIACYNSHRHIVEILLQNGADVNAIDCFGKRAIDRCKEIEVFEMLEVYEDRVHTNFNDTQADENSCTPTPYKLTRKTPRGYGAELSLEYEHSRELNRSLDERRDTQTHHSEDFSPLRSVYQFIHDPEIYRMHQRAGLYPTIDPKSLSRSSSPSRGKSRGRSDERREPDAYTLTHERSDNLRTLENLERNLNLNIRNTNLYERSSPRDQASSARSHRRQEVFDGSADAYNKHKRSPLKTQQAKARTQPLVPVTTQSAQLNSRSLRAPLNQLNQSNQANSAKVRPTVNNENLKSKSSPREKSGNVVRSQTRSDKPKSKEPVQALKKTQQGQQRKQQKQPPRQQQRQTADFDPREALAGYVKDFSSRMEKIVNKKISYALNFDWKKNAYKIRREMFELLAKRAREFNDALLSRVQTNYENLLQSHGIRDNRFDEIRNELEDFTQRITEIWNMAGYEEALDQEEAHMKRMLMSIDEVDRMLLEDLEENCEKELQREDNTLDRETIAFLHNELQQNVESVFGSMNNVLGRELSKSETLVSKLLREAIKELFGNLERNLKRVQMTRLSEAANTTQQTLPRGTQYAAAADRGRARSTEQEIPFMASVDTDDAAYHYIHTRDTKPDEDMIGSEDNLRQTYRGTDGQARSQRSERPEKKEQAKQKMTKTAVLTVQRAENVEVRPRNISSQYHYRSNENSQVEELPADNEESGEGRWMGRGDHTGDQRKSDRLIQQKIQQERRRRLRQDLEEPEMELRGDETFSRGPQRNDNRRQVVEEDQEEQKRGDRLQQLNMQANKPSEISDNPSEAYVTPWQLQDPSAQSQASREGLISREVSNRDYIDSDRPQSRFNKASSPKLPIKQASQSQPASWAAQRHIEPGQIRRDEQDSSGAPRREQYSRNDSSEVDKPRKYSGRTPLANPNMANLVPWPSQKQLNESINSKDGQDQAGVPPQRVQGRGIQSPGRSGSQGAREAVRRELEEIEDRIRSQQAANDNRLSDSGMRASVKNLISDDMTWPSEKLGEQQAKRKDSDTIRRDQMERGNLAGQQGVRQIAQPSNLRDTEAAADAILGGLIPRPSQGSETQGRTRSEDPRSEPSLTSNIQRQAGAQGKALEEVAPQGGADQPRGRDKDREPGLTISAASQGQTKADPEGISGQRSSGGLISTAQGRMPQNETGAAHQGPEGAKPTVSDREGPAGMRGHTASGTIPWTSQGRAAQVDADVKNQGQREAIPWGLQVQSTQSGVPGQTTSGTVPWTQQGRVPQAQAGAVNPGLSATVPWNQPQTSSIQRGGQASSGIVPWMSQGQAAQGHGDTSTQGQWGTVPWGSDVHASQSGASSQGPSGTVPWNLKSAEQSQPRGAIQGGTRARGETAVEENKARDEAATSSREPKEKAKKAARVHQEEEGSNQYNYGDGSEIKGIFDKNETLEKFNKILSRGKLHASDSEKNILVEEKRRPQTQPQREQYQFGDDSREERVHEVENAPGRRTEKQAPKQSRRNILPEEDAGLRATSEPVRGREEARRADSGQEGQRFSFMPDQASVNLEDTPEARSSLNPQRGREDEARRVGTSQEELRSMLRGTQSGTNLEEVPVPRGGIDYRRNHEEVKGTDDVARRDVPPSHRPKQKSVELEGVPVMRSNPDSYRSRDETQGVGVHQRDVRPDLRSSQKDVALESAPGARSNLEKLRGKEETKGVDDVSNRDFRARSKPSEAEVGLEDAPVPRSNLYSQKGREEARGANNVEPQDQRSVIKPMQSEVGLENVSLATTNLDSKSGRREAIGVRGADISSREPRQVSKPSGTSAELEGAPTARSNLNVPRGHEEVEGVESSHRTFRPDVKTSQREANLEGVLEGRTSLYPLRGREEAKTTDLTQREAKDARLEGAPEAKSSLNPQRSVEEATGASSSQRGIRPDLKSSHGTVALEDAPEARSNLERLRGQEDTQAGNFMVNKDLRVRSKPNEAEIGLEDAPAPRSNLSSQRGREEVKGADTVDRGTHLPSRINEPNVQLENLPEVTSNPSVQRGKEAVRGLDLSHRSLRPDVKASQRDVGLEGVPEGRSTVKSPRGREEAKGSDATQSETRLPTKSNESDVRLEALPEAKPHLDLQRGPDEVRGNNISQKDTRPSSNIAHAGINLEEAPVGRSTLDLHSGRQEARRADASQKEPKVALRGPTEGPGLESAPAEKSTLGSQPGREEVKRIDANVRSPGSQSKSNEVNVQLENASVSRPTAGGRTAPEEANRASGSQRREGSEQVSSHTGVNIGDVPVSKSTVTAQQGPKEVQKVKSSEKDQRLDMVSNQQGVDLEGVPLAARSNLSARPGQEEARGVQGAQTGQRLDLTSNQEGINLKGAPLTRSNLSSQKGREEAKKVDAKQQDPRLVTNVGQAGVNLEATPAVKTGLGRSPNRENNEGPESNQYIIRPNAEESSASPDLEDVPMPREGLGFEMMQELHRAGAQNQKKMRSVPKEEAKSLEEQEEEEIARLYGTLDEEQAVDSAVKSRDEMQGIMTKIDNLWEKFDEVLARPKKPLDDIYVPRRAVDPLLRESLGEITEITESPNSGVYTADRLGELEDRGNWLDERIQGRDQLAEDIAAHDRRRSTVEGKRLSEVTKKSLPRHIEDSEEVKRDFRPQGQIQPVEAGTLSEQRSKDDERRSTKSSGKKQISIGGYDFSDEEDEEQEENKQGEPAGVHKISLEAAPAQAGRNLVVEASEEEASKSFRSPAKVSPTEGGKDVKGIAATGSESDKSGRSGDFRREILFNLTRGGSGRKLISPTPRGQQRSERESPESRPPMSSNEESPNRTEVSVTDTPRIDANNDEKPENEETKTAVNKDQRGPQAFESQNAGRNRDVLGDREKSQEQQDYYDDSRLARDEADRAETTIKKQGEVKKKAMAGHRAEEDADGAGTADRADQSYDAGQAQGRGEQLGVARNREDKREDFRSQTRLEHEAQIGIRGEEQKDEVIRRQEQICRDEQAKPSIEGEVFRGIVESDDDEPRVQSKPQEQASKDEHPTLSEVVPQQGSVQVDEPIPLREPIQSTKPAKELASSRDIVQTPVSNKQDTSEGTQPEEVANEQSRRLSEPQQPSRDVKEETEGQSEADINITESQQIEVHIPRPTDSKKKAHRQRPEDYIEVSQEVEQSQYNRSQTIQAITSPTAPLSQRARIALLAQQALNVQPTEATKQDDVVSAGVPPKTQEELKQESQFNIDKAAGTLENLSRHQEEPVNSDLKDRESQSKEVKTNDEFIERISDVVVEREPAQRTQHIVKKATRPVDMSINEQVSSEEQKQNLNEASIRTPQTTMRERQQDNTQRLQTTESDSNDDFLKNLERIQQTLIHQGDELEGPRPSRVGSKDQPARPREPSEDKPSTPHKLGESADNKPSQSTQPTRAQSRGDALDPEEGRLSRQPHSPEGIRHGDIISRESGRPSITEEYKLNEPRGSIATPINNTVEELAQAEDIQDRGDGNQLPQADEKQAHKDLEDADKEGKVLHGKLEQSQQTATARGEGTVTRPQATDFYERRRGSEQEDHGELAGSLQRIDDGSISEDALSSEYNKEAALRYIAVASRNILDSLENPVDSALVPADNGKDVIIRRLATLREGSSAEDRGANTGSESDRHKPENNNVLGQEEKNRTDENIIKGEEEATEHESAPKQIEQRASASSEPKREEQKNQDTVEGGVDQEWTMRERPELDLVEEQKVAHKPVEGRKKVVDNRSAEKDDEKQQEGLGQPEIAETIERLTKPANITGSALLREGGIQSPTYSFEDEEDEEQQQPTLLNVSAANADLRADDEATSAINPQPRNQIQLPAQTSLPNLPVSDEDRRVSSRMAISIPVQEALTERPSDDKISSLGQIRESRDETVKTTETNVGDNLGTSGNVETSKNQQKVDKEPAQRQSAVGRKPDAEAEQNHEAQIYQELHENISDIRHLEGAGMRLDQADRAEQIPHGASEEEKDAQTTLSYNKNADGSMSQRGRTPRHEIIQEESSGKESDRGGVGSRVLSADEQVNMIDVTRRADVIPQQEEVDEEVVDIDSKKTKEALNEATDKPLLEERGIADSQTNNILTIQRPPGSETVVQTHNTVEEAKPQDKQKTEIVSSSTQSQVNTLTPEQQQQQKKDDKTAQHLSQQDIKSNEGSRYFEESSASDYLPAVDLNGPKQEVLISHDKQQRDFTENHKEVAQPSSTTTHSQRPHEVEELKANERRAISLLAQDPQVSGSDIGKPTTTPKPTVARSTETLTTHDTVSEAKRVPEVLVGDQQGSAGIPVNQETSQSPLQIRNRQEARALAKTAKGATQTASLENSDVASRETARTEDPSLRPTATSSEGRRDTVNPSATPDIFRTSVDPTQRTTESSSASTQRQQVVEESKTLEAKPVVREEAAQGIQAQASSTQTYNEVQSVGTQSVSNDKATKTNEEVTVEGVIPKTASVHTSEDKASVTRHTAAQGEQISSTQEGVEKLETKAPEIEEGDVQTNRDQERPQILDTGAESQSGVFDKEGSKTGVFNAPAVEEQEQIPIDNYRQVQVVSPGEDANKPEAEALQMKQEDIQTIGNQEKLKALEAETASQPAAAVQGVVNRGDLHGQMSDDRDQKVLTTQERDEKDVVTSVDREENRAVDASGKSGEGVMITQAKDSEQKNAEYKIGESVMLPASDEGQRGAINRLDGAKERTAQDRLDHPNFQTRSVAVDNQEAGSPVRIFNDTSSSFDQNYTVEESLVNRGLESSRVKALEKDDVHTTEQTQNQTDTEERKTEQLSLQDYTQKDTALGTLISGQEDNSQLTNIENTSNRPDTSILKPQETRSVATDDKRDTDSGQKDTQKHGFIMNLLSAHDRFDNVQPISQQISVIDRTVETVRADTTNPENNQSKADAASQQVAPGRESEVIMTLNEGFKRYEEDQRIAEGRSGLINRGENYSISFGAVGLSGHTYSSQGTDRSQASQTQGVSPFGPSITTPGVTVSVQDVYNSAQSSQVHHGGELYGVGQTPLDFTNTSRSANLGPDAQTSSSRDQAVRPLDRLPTANFNRENAQNTQGASTGRDVSLGASSVADSYNYERDPISIGTVPARSTENPGSYGYQSRPAHTEARAPGAAYGYGSQLQPVDEGLGSTSYIQSFTSDYTGGFNTADISRFNYGPTGDSAINNGSLESDQREEFRPVHSGLQGLTGSGLNNNIAWTLFGDQDRTQNKPSNYDEQRLKDLIGRATELEGEALSRVEADEDADKTTTNLAELEEMRRDNTLHSYLGHVGPYGHSEQPSELQLDTVTSPSHTPANANEPLSAVEKNRGKRFFRFIQDDKKDESTDPVNLKNDLVSQDKDESVEIDLSIGHSNTYDRPVAETRPEGAKKAQIGDQGEEDVLLVRDVDNGNYDNDFNFIRDGLIRDGNESLRTYQARGGEEGYAYEQESPDLNSLLKFSADKARPQDVQKEDEGEIIQYIQTIGSVSIAPSQSNPTSNLLQSGTSKLTTTRLYPSQGSQINNFSIPINSRTADDESPMTFGNSAPSSDRLRAPLVVSENTSLIEPRRIQDLPQQQIARRRPQLLPELQTQEGIDAIGLQDIIEVNDEYLTPGFARDLRFEEEKDLQGMYTRNQVSNRPGFLAGFDSPQGRQLVASPTATSLPPNWGGFRPEGLRRNIHIEGDDLADKQNDRDLSLEEFDTSNLSKVDHKNSSFDRDMSQFQSRARFVSKDVGASGDKKDHERSYSYDYNNNSGHIYVSGEPGENAERPSRKIGDTEDDQIKKLLGITGDKANRFAQVLETADKIIQDNRNLSFTRILNADDSPLSFRSNLSHNIPKPSPSKFVNRVIRGRIDRVPISQGFHDPGQNLRIRSFSYSNDRSHLYVETENLPGRDELKVQKINFSPVKK